MIAETAEQALLKQIDHWVQAANEGRMNDGEALAAISRLVASDRMPQPTNSTVARTTPEVGDTDRAWVLKNIIETIPYLVFWKDRNSNYLGCNEGFARAAGLNTPDEIVGKNDFELPWKRAETEWFRAWDRRVIESGIPELNIEEPQLQANGRQRFISTSKVPLRDSSGKIVGVLGIFNDITDRKMLEEDLRLAKEAAEVSALAKTDFLAAMSHELRTPLTLILSPVEWLLRQKRSDLSTSVVDSLMCVQRNAHRLMILTDDILEFSKYEAGHLKLKTQALDVSNHVKQLMLDFEPTAEARGISLKLEWIDELGSVMLDIAKFDKIFINLISNALKFTPSLGEVSVSLRLRDDTIALAVADNGIGIDISDHDRIFRRFEQIEGGLTRSYGGTGLGLSLVKVFAELMGGSVSVESALGKGATFTVRIPRTLADERINDAARDVVSYQRGAFTLEPVGHDTLAQAPSRDSPHVVLAEDNGDLRRYLTDLLSAEFRVTALADGQSAYDVIRKEQPDVVVSDVMMPLMDGFELIAKLKSDPGLATIPVLLLTARAGAEMSADSMDRGADDYLTKPFSPLDLLARVRAAYRMRQLYTSLVEAERRASESEQREALQKMRAELAHVNRVSMMGEQAVSLIHEITQPIATARNNARAALNFLDRQPPGLAEVREALACVVGDADRAGDIIDRIRDHIRKAPPRKASFDLNEAIDEVIVLGRSAITMNGVLVQTLLAKGLAPVQGDRVQLQQVILNLVLNAVEAMSSVEAGMRELLISTEQTQTGDILVAVRDSGPGINPEHLERVFEAFYTTKTSGVGMGLSICRSIIDAHGGRLWASANKPQGAVFQFTLSGATSRS